MGVFNDAIGVAPPQPFLGCPRVKSIPSVARQNRSNKDLHRHSLTADLDINYSADPVWRHSAASSFAAEVIINEIGRTGCELLHTTHLFPRDRLLSRPVSSWWQVAASIAGQAVAQ